MKAIRCPRTHTEASASLAALAVALLVTTLAVGCLRLVTGAMIVGQRRSVPQNAVTVLVSLASQVTAALTENRAALPGEGARTIVTGPELTVHLRDLSSSLGDSGTSAPGLQDYPIPLHPVITEPRQIEFVYEERTGSGERARRFAADMSRLVSTGVQLEEADVRRAAGADYPSVAGLITAAPLLNLNTAPAVLLQTLPEILAPDDVDAAAAISATITRFLIMREHRLITADEIASAIQAISRATATPGGLVGQLTAYLGVRTWIWELRVEHNRWTGTAIIADLPAQPAAMVLGLAVEANEWSMH
jgi:hypothetical protein